MVSNVTITIFYLNLLFSVVVPCILLIAIRKRYEASVMSFVIGCGVWFVTFFLELVIQGLILYLPIGGFVDNNIVVSIATGVLFEVIFVESLRYVAMKFLLKRKQDNPYNSIMYGAGCGGFELFYPLWIITQSQLACAQWINGGTLDSQLINFSVEQQQDLLSEADYLINTSSYEFLFDFAERIPLLIMHIALSVLIWAVIVNGRKIMYPAAMAIHFVIQVTFYLMNGFGIPRIVVALLLLGMALVAAYYAKKVFEEVVVVGSPQRY